MTRSPAAPLVDDRVEIGHVCPAVAPGDRGNAHHRVPLGLGAPGHRPLHAAELGEGFAASSMSAHAGIYSYRYCLLHVADCRSGRPHPQAMHSDALLAWVERECLLDGVRAPDAA